MEQVSKRFMNWASILEDNTREQVEMTSRMPFIHPHVALMPDAHLGKGCAVGAVLPTKGAIMPAAVGVDIGCGMMALRLDTTRSEIDRRDLSELREAIEHAIPLSPGNYNGHVWGPGTDGRIEQLEDLASLYHIELDSYAPNWRYQLGSLGGGNHFIEVCLDEDDHVWLFLHSGSRGVGNKIATHHIKVAQKQCAKRYIELPHKDLAYLVEGDDEFWTYIRDLRWAQEFARLNRDEMMERVYRCFQRWFGGPPAILDEINCHHNYTVQEKHFGEQVWLSRKGAIDASEGTWGLIPGSMGAASYVVAGKGNRLALNSSPHGAGRAYGRKHAERTFTVDQLEESMAGIEWSHSAEFLDEIPAAYKPIDQVMEDAADLVEVKHTLHQLLNVKGT